MAIEVYDLRISYGLRGLDTFDSCFCSIYEFITEELYIFEFWVDSCFIVAPFLANDNNPPLELDLLSS